MKTTLTPSILAAMLALVAGCAETTGAQYGATTYSSPAASVPASSYTGHITDIQPVKMDSEFKFGIGSVVGAVAGGLLGNQIGAGGGRTAATIAGAAVGGAAGTAVESKLNKQEAERVTVALRNGATVTVVQPLDSRLHEGMRVRVVGSGEDARVAPM